MRITDEEKEKWWRLRNGNPPVMPKQIAVRFSVSSASVRTYLKARADRESMELPVDHDAVMVKTLLFGKFSADMGISIPVRKKPEEASI